VNVWTLSILLTKGNYFFEGVIKSHRILSYMDCLRTRGNLSSCVTSMIALCSSGAISAAVCSDFSRVVFSQL